jgi:hypothetical protein
VTILGTASPSKGTFDPTTDTWTIGNLAQGQTVTLRYAAQIGAGGTLTTTAVVSADQLETTLVNNVSSTPVTTPLPEPDVNKDLYLSSSAPAVNTSLSPTSLPAPVAGSTALYATGAGPGGMPLVQVFDRGTGQLRLSFLAFDAGYRGGVSVAMGDVNGDGVPDVVVAAGAGGGSNVKVFDGSTGALLSSFFAFAAGYQGAISVAAGDVTGDGRADIIVGAGVGGHSNVKVLDGMTGQVISSFFAFDPGYMGAISVAAGDVTGGGRADVIVGAGVGGHSNVRVFNGSTGQELSSFFAFYEGFIGAISVAAGDVTGGGRADIIVGAGVGGGSNVKVLDGTTGATVASFFAFGAGYAGAVNVAAADVDNSGRADVVVSTAVGALPEVIAYDPLTGEPIDAFYAYDTSFLGGVSISATNK